MTSIGPLEPLYLPLIACLLCAAIRPGETSGVSESEREVPKPSGVAGNDIPEDSRGMTDGSLDASAVMRDARAPPPVLQTHPV